MLIIIKLINGVEVIGSCKKQSARSITIEDPVQINYKNVESTVPSVSLTRYMLFSKKKEQTFAKTQVLNISEPVTGMADYYHTALEHFRNEVDQVVEYELARVAGTDDQLEDGDKYEAILHLLPTNQIPH